MAKQKPKPVSEKKENKLMTPRKREPDLSREIYELLLQLVSPLKSIAVQETDSIALIRPEDIAFMTTTISENKLTLVDRKGKQWIRYDTLTEMMKLLKQDKRFFQTHRSYIANLYLVRNILMTPTGRELLFLGLPDSMKCQVSRNNVVELEKLLGVS